MADNGSEPVAGQRRSFRAALVGQGISGSFTPAMHMAQARALGLNYTYDLIDTDTKACRAQPLSAIVETARARGFAGLNITHPYKIDIIAHLDALSDDARRLGSVNTVVFREGLKIGHNTDYTGFAAVLQSELRMATKNRVLLLGAGGAGVAVAFALLDSGTETLLIHDIAPEHMHNLVRKIAEYFPKRNVHCVATLDRTTMSGLCGVINATPMGMAKHPGTAIAPKLLSPEIWVADIVYFPLQTRLLAEARKIGCDVTPGSAMAVAQAEASFELLTGHRTEPGRMTQVFERLSER